MGSIVMPEVPVERLLQMAPILKRCRVATLMFDAAKEPFHEDVAVLAALSTHVDPDVMLFESLCEGLNGELDTISVLNISGVPWLRAFSRISMPKSVSMAFENRQDSTSQLFQSTMATRYMKPQASGT